MGSAFINWILTGVGIVTFLAAAAAYLRGSADRGTITSLQNSINALKTENELAKGKAETQQVTIADQSTEIEKLRGDLSTLRATVTQAAEVAHMQQTLDAHHEQTIAELRLLRLVIEEAK